MFAKNDGSRKYNTKHSPFPWKIVSSNSSPWGKIEVGDKRLITIEGNSYEEARANVKLILTACHYFYRLLDSGRDVENMLFKALEEGSIVFKEDVAPVIHGVMENFQAIMEEAEEGILE